MGTILAFITFVLFAFYLLRRAAVVRERSDFIDRFSFDLSIQRRVADQYPHLTPSQIQSVLEGLRDYFKFSLHAKGMLSMPSQAVDEAWHAFILSTKAYDRFCQRAFGKFLHHHPAETMASPTQATRGIKRIWNLACRKENINPSSPQRLPRLFALDSELKIPGGLVYALNCLATGAANSYCASEIGGGCGGGGCGGGDSDGGSGDSGCGGGCGGGD